jgi:hypothetical protein
MFHISETRTFINAAFARSITYGNFNRIQELLSHLKQLLSVAIFDDLFLDDQHNCRQHAIPFVAHVHITEPPTRSWRQARMAFTAGSRDR